MKLSISLLPRVFILFLISSGAFAQTNAQLHWYFSENNNNLFFDQNNFQPRLEIIPNSLNAGQSGVVSDLVTGELIFYTDGTRVFDRYHRLVSNGSGLLANPDGSQAVAVSAVPGQDNKGEFYIFTNSATLTAPGDVVYSVYDTALFGAGAFPEPPAGNIILTEKNIPIADLQGNSSPAMIMVPNASFDGFWLITHERNTENYRVTEILNDGTIGATNSYDIPGAPMIAHTLAYTDSSIVLPNLPTIAIAPQNNSNVMLVNFDPETGVLEINTAVSINNTDQSMLANENIFDIEFSPSGQFLYVSGNFNGAADSLMQVDLSDPTYPMTKLNTVAAMGRSYGLQTGPDDLIYHLYEANGEINLGRINVPDSAGSEAFYSRNAIGSSIFDSKQFASFQPLIRPQLEVDFEVAGTCANSPVIFLPTIIPAADSVLWDFGDGNTANSLSAKHTYVTGGNYLVTLSAYSNGFPTDTAKTIIIQEFDFEITDMPDTVVCPENFPLSLTAEGEGETSVTYRWSNLDTDGETTSIDSAGIYYVVATNQTTGCSTYDAVRVEEYGAEELRGAVWYFGEHAGIDFNPVIMQLSPDPVPIPYGDPDIFNGGNEMVAPEGCAIYCDQNGLPVFYSDGRYVYDREGTLVDSLSGDPGATQSALILEDPSDATLFYIFTTEEIYDPSGNISYKLRYSIFDLKKRSGLGDLLRNISGEVIEQVLMISSTERITGNDQWVIAHEYGTNIFRAFELTATGLSAPVISQIGSVHPTSVESAGRGYMKLAQGLLAVALPLENSNHIEIFDFLDSSGVVNNFREINVNADYNLTGNIYGLEISDRKIFGSLNGGSESYIVEYWLDSLDNPIPQPGLPITSSYTIGALQVAPTGTIYAAIDGQPFLGTLSPTSDTTTASQFQEQSFALAPGTLSRLGLPNFISEYSNEPIMPVIAGSNGCPGEDISFSITGTSNFDVYTWNIIRISDGTVVEGPFQEGPARQSTYIFNSMEPGEYEASVFISNECSNSPDETITYPFTIFNPPAIVLTPQDASACGASDGQLDILMNFSGNYNYVIRNNGELIDGAFDVNNANITLTDITAGVYSVFVLERTNGCTNTESIIVGENSPFQINEPLSITRSDCEGEGGSLDFSVDANVTFPITYTLYDATSNDVLNSTSNVNTSDNVINNIPAGNYYLEVEDQNGCSDFIREISIIEPDTATLLTDLFVSACSVSEIRIGAQTPNGENIVWGTNPSLGDSITVSQPGIYTVTAIGDEISTCDNTKEVSVIFNDASSNPYQSQYIICPDDPITTNAQVGLYPGSIFIQQEFYTEDGNLINENTPGFSFIGDSIYIFTAVNLRAILTNAVGCTTEANISVLESCKARITVPNAFIPSSSNELNRAFSIYTKFIDPESFQIIIFNRWGEIVYESNDPDFAWDGTKYGNGSEPLVQGTYAYIIRYVSEFEPLAGAKMERGAIQLLR